MSSSTHTLPPVRPSRPSVEDRYRAALQIIARGGPGGSRPIRSEQAQDLARKALIEMGDGWTKQGLAAAENQQQSGS